MKNTFFALETYKSLQDLIKFIDQKAGVILILLGLIVSSFLHSLYDINLENLGWIEHVIVFMSIGVTLTLICVTFDYCFLKVLKPRLSSMDLRTSKKSLIYFQDIANANLTDVILRAKSINEEEILEDIVTQNHQLAKIMELKTAKLNDTLILLFSTLLSYLIFEFILFLVN